MSQLVSSDDVPRRMWRSAWPGGQLIGRSAPVVLLLLLGAAGASADVFNITFSGGLAGTGSLTTNGTCLDCALGLGLLSFSADIGLASGASAFDIVDDGNASLLHFDRGSLTLWEVGGTDLFDSETHDSLGFFGSPGNHNVSSHPNTGGILFGSYIVSPTTAVPEPSSVIFLVTLVVILQFLSYRKTPRPS